MGPDLIIVLVIVLIVVLIWRGPKTLPSLGRAFGQGVREARKEIDGMKADAGASKPEPPKDDTAP
jgi:TatA/E family protein of Tat protein translocase